MNTIHSAYELIREEDLKDIGSKGYVLRHKKSGASLALVENDDENKVFYIGFRTPVDDSTGVPHIIEHSVLCGSEKYPLKDPFVELVKGSLNTFLNAMTYPDKTVYPVASTNDKDFANLMDVYMDAVLHPNIYKEEKIFKQEGWHYELDDVDGELTLNGVVYNEMKGAFSSPDDILERAIMHSLFPDTTYHYESGGDPEDIPTLTYENFIDFHKRYYHPCNSYIYMYGDMDMNERLDYLDREYLSKYEKIELDSQIYIQSAFDAPVEEHKAYSISSDEDSSNQTYLSLNFVIANVLNPKLYQAFDILDYALISAPGAPLRKALLDSGICEDVMGGYDSGTLQPTFTIVAKGANPEDKEKFLSIVRDTLDEQVKNGINKDALYGAINANQFRFREADFGSYPKGLIYGLNLLDSWLYDEERPFMHLFGSEILDGLYKEVETGYFEELVKQYLVDNTHASIVVVEPEIGLTTKEDEALAKKLASYKATLSKEDLERLVKETKELKEYQEEPTSPEDLKKIPILAREDLRKEVRPFDLIEKKVGDIPVLHHDVSTNGIHYLRLIFKADKIAESKFPVISLLSRILGMVDTGKYSYIDLSNEVNKRTGGISIFTENISRYDRDYILTFNIKAKFLYENLCDAFEFIEEVLFNSDLSDDKRLREIIMQEKSHLESQMNMAGHTVAALRAMSYFSRSAKASDALNGITYYQYIKNLDEHFDEEVENLRSECMEILKTVVRPENLVISTTGKDKAFGQVEEIVPKLLPLLHDETCRITVPNIRCEGRNEGFKTAAKVQYVCRAGNFKSAGYPYTGSMRLLKVILGYDYFWTNVRVKGGAYGCMSNFNRNGDFAFVSYRDPNLTKTIEVFEKTADYLRNFDVDDRDMTKFIIGTISAMDTPLTPSQKGSRAVHAYFSEITYDELQEERLQVINATQQDVRDLAKCIEDAMSQNYLCVVGNEDAITENEDVFEKIQPLFSEVEDE